MFPGRLDANRLALWAALPMAQSSKIERRLTIILDGSRRRSLPRRAFGAGTALGVALLVPLAMVRPVAQAQAAPARAETVQLLGVQDIDIHHTDHHWWNAAGQRLAGGVEAEAPSRTVTDLFGSSNEHNLRFVFRLPNAVKSDAVTFSATESFVYPRLATQQRSQNGWDWTLYTTFLDTRRTTTVIIGVASGPWTETVNCAKTPGKVRMSRASGEVLFTLVPDRLPLTGALAGDDLVLAEATQKNAVLIVSDHFHYPSPLKIDKMALMISSYATPRKSGSEVQRLMHDGENYDRAVYGLDKSGRVIAKLAGGGFSELDADDRFKRVQTFSVPRPLLRRIASFRLVARPYQWTEFRDVALQPAIAAGERAGGMKPTAAKS